MQLYRHQKELIAEAPNKHLLAFGTGTGKTAIAIRLAESKGSKILVSCPKALVCNWRDEIAKWSERANVSWEIFSKENLKKLDRTSADVVILDEGHFWAGIKSQLHKRTMKLIKDVPHVYILTATPYLSSMWNIYALANLLGCKWHYREFLYKFFSRVSMGQLMIWTQKKTIDGNTDKWWAAELIGRIGSTKSLEECIDVPEQTHKKELLKMTDSQKKGIKALIDLLPIVRFTKEHQIAGGSLKGDGYVGTEYFKTEKLNRTIELVREADKGIVIVCRYTAEIEFLKEKLEGKGDIFIITGATKDRHSVVGAINKHQRPIVIVNAACSEGYNIPRIPMMVFYSVDFSLKNLIQMQGRIQRINNIKKNIYIYLVITGSIDEKIYQSVVVDKVDFQKEIYGNKNTEGQSC